MSAPRIRWWMITVSFLAGMTSGLTCGSLTAHADPWDPVMPTPWYPDDDSPPDSWQWTKDPPHCAVIKACAESWDCLHAQTDATLIAWADEILGGGCPNTQIDPPKKPVRA